MDGWREGGRDGWMFNDCHEKRAWFDWLKERKKNWKPSLVSSSYYQRCIKVISIYFDISLLEYKNNLSLSVWRHVNIIMSCIYFPLKIIHLFLYIHTLFMHITCFQLLVNITGILEIFDIGISFVHLWPQLGLWAHMQGLVKRLSQGGHNHELTWRVYVLSVHDCDRIVNNHSWGSSSPWNTLWWVYDGWLGEEDTLAVTVYGPHQYNLVHWKLLDN